MSRLALPLVMPHVEYMKSSTEEAFAFWLTALENQDIPWPVREYRFDPSRKWRFDFAWPAERVAVEIEGVLHGGGGRHQRVAGFLADCEKYEAALAQGWRVYRVPGQWVLKGGCYVFRAEVMATLRTLLIDTPHVEAP